MSHKSLGEFIKAAEEMGDVKVIHGADLELEVFCLTEQSTGLDRS